MADEGRFWIEEKEGYLILENEGREERFVIEEELYLGDQKYLILVPAELIDSDDETALIFKTVQEGDGEALVAVEDDQEFELVKEAYYQGEDEE